MKKSMLVTALLFLFLSACGGLDKSDVYGKWYFDISSDTYMVFEETGELRIYEGGVETDVKNWSFDKRGNQSYISIDGNEAKAEKVGKNLWIYVDEGNPLVLNRGIDY